MEIAPRTHWLAPLLLALLLGCPDGSPSNTDFDDDGTPDSTDCAPRDGSVYPGAPDPFGDGVDQDCDGQDGVDRDADGYPVAGDGVADDDEDCDDNDPDVNPGVTEVVGDDVDQDCDGQDDVDADGDGFVSEVDCDDSDPAANLADADGDGATTCDTIPDCDDSDPDANPLDADGDTVSTCAPVPDCDDADPSRSPLDLDGDGSTTCDAVPDCDDADSTLSQTDDDGDGTSSCDGDCDDDDDDLNLDDADADGTSSCGGDCDDDDDSRHPGAAASCDGVDTDCDGSLEADETDGDGDGATDCQGDCDDTTAAQNLLDLDGDGATSCDGDCDDGDGDIGPGQPELCNGEDDDCSGAPEADEVDGDGDGAFACADCDDTDGDASALDGDLDGFDECEGDCLEGNPTFFPGASDPWGDNQDTNCDGADGLDADGDGVPGSGPAVPDCDDGDPSVYPGAADPCDGLDSDCVADASEVDGDGDGSPPCAGDCNDTDPAVNTLDSDGDGVSSCAGDCDDDATAIYPGAPDICDGVDSDCTADPDDADSDGDGEPPCAGDCDDTDPALNTLDADGDGDDSCGDDCDDTDPLVNDSDGDGDGFSGCDGDCDDNASAAFPGGTEVCDGLDNDCDGQATIVASYERPPGPDLRAAYDNLLCAVIEVEASVTITSYELQAWPDPFGAIQLGVYSAQSSAGPWTREWYGTEEYPGSAVAWFASPIIDLAFAAGDVVALCLRLEGDIAWYGDWSNPGLPADVGFGTMTSVIDEIEVYGYPPTADLYTSEYYMPVRINSVATELDEDGDGLPGCEDCDDSDPLLNDEDLDGDGLSGCGGDCYPADGSLPIPPGQWDVLGDGLDEDCDGTDGASLAHAGRLLDGRPNDRLGKALGTVPDIDGDGLPELLLTAYRHDGADDGTGEVLLLPGSFIATLPAGEPWLVDPSEAIVTFAGVEIDDRLGEQLAVLSDLDADGYAELALATTESGPQAWRPGAVYIFTSQGGTWGGPTVTTASAALTIDSSTANGYFSRVTLAGNLDGDGLLDLVVTDSEFEWYSERVGRTHVFRGSDLALQLGGGTITANDAWAWLTGPHTLAAPRFGERASILPDMDLDGTDELAIGTLYGNAQAGGFGVHGEVHVVFGASLAGGDCDLELGGCTDVVVYAEDADQQYQSAGMADLDGDGRGELIVAAPAWHQPGGTNVEGRVLVYTGADLVAATGTALDGSAAALRIEGVVGSLLTGAGVFSPGDLDGDGKPELLASQYQLGGDGGDRSGWRVFDGAVMASAAAGTGVMTSNESVAALMVEDPQDGALYSGGPAADYDGDGALSFWIGAPDGDHGSSDGGRLYLVEMP